MQLAPNRLAVVSAYAACVLIWGTTWLGIKVSLATIPPISGAGIRFIIAGLALYAFAALRGVDVRKATPPFAVIGTLALTMFGANYALTYTAETHLSSGLVAVLFGTLPFFVFAFAHYMVGEHATRNTLAGATLALIGVALISISGREHGDVTYVLCALGAAAVSAYANVYLKRHAQSEPLATLPPAMLLAGVAMAAWGVRYEPFDLARATAPASLAALAYLAICGSCIAFYLNHWLLQRIDSTTMGLSALMIPVIAVLVGATLGHEAFSLRDVIGALFVCIGVALSLAQTSHAAQLPAYRGARASK